MRKNDKIFLGTLGAGAAILSVLTFCAPIPAVADEVKTEDIAVEWYSGYAEGLGLFSDFCGRAGVPKYDTVCFTPDSLTTEYLVHRQEPDHGYVVEEFIGVCVDNNGNGQILNTTSECNYISYKDCDIYKGDIVVTYCLFDPEGCGEDDVTWREDYVIDTNQLIEEDE